jgi:hypothetical protein
MPESDHSFKIIARVSGRSLARVAGLECRTWKPSESTLQATTERLADRVFIASQKTDPFVVYFEFVTTWTKAVCWSVLGKSGMLAERERLPVACLIFILRRKNYKPQQGTMHLKIGGKSVQQVWFREERLWEIEPEPWWENDPGLMALYPLCRHGEKPAESILHAADRIEHNEKDSVVRADLLTSLGLFGKLAYPGLDMVSLIGREKMKESKMYQEIKKEGKDEGLEEGRGEGSRKTLLAVVRARFGKRQAESFQSVLKNVVDPNRLESLAELVANCKKFDELIDAASR